MIDTNIEKLTFAIKFASSGNSSEMKEAEAYLVKRKELPDYLRHLLVISVNRSFDNQIRLIAAIQLKNFVENYWKFNSNMEYNKSLLVGESSDIIVISDEEKSFFREEIFKAASECEVKPLLKTYVESVHKVIKFDFKDTWKESFMAGIHKLLSSNLESQIYAALSLFYQVTKIYEYETTKNKGIYNDALSSIFPQITTFGNTLKAQLDNEVGLIILKKILKIIYRSIQSDMPTVLLDTNNFEGWLMIILTILSSITGASKSAPEDSFTSNYWKIEINCSNIIYKIFQKYANFNTTDSNVMKAFSQSLDNKYAPEVLNVLFQVLEKSKTQQIPDKILCYIYKFFSKLVGKGLLMNVISPRLEVLLNDFIIETAVLSKKDLLTRAEDQKEYIYRQFDITLTFYDKRYACCQFIKACCEYGTYDPKTKKLISPEFFKSIYNYIVLLFDNYDQEIKAGKTPNPLIKEASMALFEAIAPCALEHCSADVLENIIKMYILPELTGEYNKSKYTGVLKEKACFIIKVYSKLDYKDNSLMETIVGYLSNLLSDQDLSVRIVTSLTLPALMSKPYVLKLLQSHIKTLLEVYLNLMNQIDLEELLGGLESIIDKFDTGVMEFAIPLTQELAQQFHRLINTNIENDDGEGQMAAEGVITTLQKIISICGTNDELMSKIEVTIIPIINYCLSDDGFELLDDGIETIRILLTKPNKISPTTWSYFTRLNFSIIGDEEQNKQILAEYPGSALEGIGYDNLNEILQIIHLYIVKDPSTFINGLDNYNKKYVERLLQTVTQIFANSSGPKDFESCLGASKILVSMIDSIITANSTNLGLSLDIYIEHILALTSSALTKTKNSSYRSYLIQLLSSILLYNTDLTLAILNKLKLTENVLLVWLKHITDVKFQKQLNKCLFGLTTLINVLPELESKYQINASKVVPSLIEKIAVISEKTDAYNQKKKEKPNHNDDDDADNEDQLDKYLKAVSLKFN